MRGIIIIKKLMLIDVKIDIWNDLSLSLMYLCDLITRRYGRDFHSLMTEG